MNKVLFSSKKTDWETPQDLFDQLNSLYGPFDIDVCATFKNKKCPLYYGLKNSKLDEQWTDGLNQPWALYWNKCWMNPPYGKEIGKWVKKAYEESVLGTFVCALLPSRTDTKWFHEYIYGNPGVVIEFIKGRLKFGKAKNPTPFPSMIVRFWPKSCQCIEFEEAHCIKCGAEQL